MKTILKQVLINSPESPNHGKTMDILIENGIISKIAESISDEGDVIEGDNLQVSAGWVDMMSNFCDPGLEHKETINTGLKCAKNGGYTNVCLSPETSPFKSWLKVLVLS